MSTYENYEAQSLEIIHSAKKDFGIGLYALSSFGAESALLSSLIQKSGERVPIVTIDTGYWFKETHWHQETLENQLGFRALKYGLEKPELLKIDRDRLWDNDLEEYNRRTKVEPLSAAIKELGVTALLSGVRGYQNENRASFKTYGVGNDKEWRIHPVLDWTEEAVIDYLADEGLPHHPLVAEGYQSIGDWTITKAGDNRSGRNLGPKSECGIQPTIQQAHTA